MADGRSTIIDFVEKYTAKYSGKTFLREKSGGVWTETSFKKTRDESRILAAGFMALGLRKGDKVALLSEGRKLWVMAELGILYAGGVQSGLQSSKFVVASAAALPALREELDSLPSVKKVIVLDELPLREGEVFIGELREMGLKFLKDKAAKLEERIASAGEAGPALACKPSDVAVREGSVLLMALPQGRSSEQLAGLCTMMKNGGSVATMPAGEDLSDVIGAVRPHILLTAPDVIRDFKNGVEDSVRAKGPRTQRLFDWAVRHAKDRPHVVRLLDCKLFKPVREKVFGGRMEFIVGGGALPDEDILRWYSAIGLPVVQNRETI